MNRHRLYRLVHNSVGIISIVCHECGHEVDGSFYYHQDIAKCPRCGVSFVPKHVHSFDKEAKHV